MVEGILLVTVGALLGGGSGGGGEAPAAAPVAAPAFQFPSATAQLQQMCAREESFLHSPTAAGGGFFFQQQQHHQQQQQQYQFHQQQQFGHKDVYLGEGRECGGEGGKE